MQVDAYAVFYIRIPGKITLNFWCENEWKMNCYVKFRFFSNEGNVQLVLPI